MSFENASVPPPIGSTDFSLYLWERVKSRSIAPTFSGGFSCDEGLRREFLVGARMMGFELVDLENPAELARLAQMNPPRQPLQPQQLVIADALNHPSDEYVIEIVRRAAKTTTIFAWCMGRCKSRPGYQVTFSAQNGVAGSRRLREWAGRLDAISPPDDLDLPPWLRGRSRPSKQQLRAVALFGDDVLPHAEQSAGRGFRVMRGEVGKGIYFDNGSQFLVLKPEAEAYRGEAADVSWIDEAQEVDPEEGDDLLAGILPLQDTKVGSAIVLSGTAGEARVGPFWTYVKRMRDGDPDIGGLDFCAPEDTEWSVIEDEGEAMDLLARVHPGIGTLTTLDKMRKNWRTLPRPQWAREYLSLWPKTAGERVVNAELWEAAKAARRPKIPARVAFGLDIKPGGSVAAIVAAWRDSRGTAYLEVVDHRSGTDWLPEVMQRLSTTYRGSTHAFDDIAEGKATATESQVLRPKPRMRMQTYRETAAGCVQIMRDLQRAKLRHMDQPGMNAAVAVAGRREVRSDNGVWLFTPSNPATDDITCLMAGVRALRNWDQHYANGGNKLRPTGEAAA